VDILRHRVTASYNYYIIIQWLRLKNLSELFLHPFEIYERCWGQSPHAVDGHLGPSSSVITAHCNLDRQGSPPENVGHRWLQ